MQFQFSALLMETKYEYTAEEERKNSAPALLG
jgi:hypothetical protein